MRPWDANPFSGDGTYPPYTTRGPRASMIDLVAASSMMLSRITQTVGDSDRARFAAPIRRVGRALATLSGAPARLDVRQRAADEILSAVREFTRPLRIPGDLEESSATGPATA